MIGKTVGKYRIIERLGRGGMGTVYRALDETLDRDVAIKVLNSDFDDPDVLKRFRAEAVTLARLNHPGIATIYELHRQDDDLLMVMEYVRGETVHALAERLGTFAVPQAAHICIQVLDALAHAHRAGIVHRDLKPANLMTSETGTIKVMDFGIARMLGSEHFTQGGYMMGTPAFMSPEQVTGKEIDGRSDLYSIGVVLYRLLAGELPFQAETSIAMIQKQLTEAPTPIATFRPDLPSWCVKLVERSLAKAPADRFQSAEEFRAALASGVTPETLGELPTMLTPAPKPTVARPVAAVDIPTRQPAAPPVPPPSPAPAPAPTQSTTTVVLGRTHLVTLGAVLIVLVAGIAVLGFLALRQSSGGLPQTAGQQGAPPAGSSAPGTVVPLPPAPLPPPPAVTTSTQRAAAEPVPPTVSAPTSAAPPKSSAPSTSSASSSSTSGATSGTKAAPAPPAPTTAAPAPPAPTTAAPAPPAVAAPTPEGPARGGFGGGRRGRAEARGLPPGGRGGNGRAEDPAAPAPRVLPAEPSEPLVVNNIRLAQYDASRGMGVEKNAVLRLGGGVVTILDRGPGTPLVTVPYGAIIAAFISRAPQPWWRTQDGRAMTGKVDVGRGFLRSQENWLVVTSRNQLPVVIQILDNSVRDAVTGFHERTGVPVQRFIPQ